MTRDGPKNAPRNNNRDIDTICHGIGGGASGLDPIDKNKGI